MKIAVPPLSPGAIHLWEIDLDHFIFNDVLSEDERARAAKFRFDHDRKRFKSGRTALRLLLAGYLKANPEKIEFSYGPAGKPAVNGATVSFNLAHSGPQALLAIAFGQQIGVDVELIRELPDLASLAQYSFSPGEFQRWQSLPEDQKVRAFYRCWTRKEAYLKAIGEGIAHRLQKFEVAFEPSAAPAILRGAEGNWTVIDTSREPYAGAIACDGPAPKLETYSLASV
jgi:4'-phosphopantetheinyl transferase